MTHKTELEACRKLVEATGGKCNVTGQSRRSYGSKGIPDLYCQWTARRVQGNHCPARRLWFEVKVGRDVPSVDQAEFIARERLCGGQVLVGDSTVLAACHADVLLELANKRRP